jgi:putative transposase
VAEKNVPLQPAAEAQLLFVDETTVSLHPPLRRCWMRRGQRKIIPGAGASQHLHIFGAYDWASGFVSYTLTERKNSDSFVAFLEHLLADYQHQKLILVMDNASYHHSAAAQAALSLFAERILVLWLPKYSPYLNPIERFWLHLKNYVVANRLHRSLDDLRYSLNDFFDTQQNRWFHPDRLFFIENFRLLA